jgi:uncharacterized protein with von Willebrand factor type A (vWA) domain
MHRVLTEFLQQVRAAGVPISLAESIDAVRAAAAVGIERERLREALASAVIKDEADRSTYDEIFEKFFSVGREKGRAKARTAAQGGELGSTGKGEQSSGRREPSEEATEGHPKRPSAISLRPADSARRRGDRNPEIERRQRRRRLLSLPFRELEPPEAEELSALAAELARRFRGRLRRRLRRARRGRLDFRRTLRRSIAHGGAPFDLELRRRRPGSIDLVALCDVSGSVRHATDFFAAILAPCRDWLRTLRLFVFVDHAVEATFEEGRLVPHAAVDMYAFSDFGRTLAEFERGFAGALGRNTVLLVLGDARNNRRPARADVLGRLGARVRAVWWLVPESRALWGGGDSAIGAYRPFCDEVIECADAGTLVAALDRLTR